MAQAAGGMRVLMSYGNCCPSPLVLVTTRNFADNNKEKIIAFLRGQRDKVALIQSDAAKPPVSPRVRQNVRPGYPRFRFHIVFMRIDYSLEPDESILTALRTSAQDLLVAGQVESIPNLPSTAVTWKPLNKNILFPLILCKFACDSKNFMIKSDRW
jgi:hypothetical protein